MNDLEEGLKGMFGELMLVEQSISCRPLNRVESRGFIYTSSCCVVTDQMGAPSHNIDEQWPTPSFALIYGESKSVSRLIYVM